MNSNRIVVKDLITTSMNQLAGCVLLRVIAITGRLQTIAYTQIVAHASVGMKNVLVTQQQTALIHLGIPVVNAVIFLVQTVLITIDFHALVAINQNFY